MDEMIAKRVMPHDSDAERTVICAMIWDKDAISIASETLIPEDFYEKQYGIIFDTIVDMDRHSKPVDVITLQDALKDNGAPEELTRFDYLMEFVDERVTSANVGHHANIVKNFAVLRKLIHTNDEINNMCFSSGSDIEELLDTTEKRVFEIVQKRSTGDTVGIYEIMANVMDKIVKAKLAGGSVTGIATGFTELDYATTGFQPSDLILIAARPSMGKTAFVLNIAQYVCFRLQKCAAIFSLEMSKEQLANRLLSMESTVDAQHLRTGNISDKELGDLHRAFDVIADSPLIIDDTPGISIGELRSKCRRYKHEHDLQIIIIDYLQLMSGGGRSESRQQEISEISRSLKSLARELNVPVIALSQLSRAVERRDDKRPMLSDLRESGAIEQDADVVMFLYRDEYYTKEQSDKKGIAEVIIAKQRNGPVKTIELAWIANLTRFGNLDKGRRDEQ